MHPPRGVGLGHIESPLSVRMSPVEYGFRVTSFEYIGVLDSYFIHIIYKIQVKFDLG